MRTISQAAEQSLKKAYLKCTSCNETFINNILAKDIYCPNGCKIALTKTDITESPEERIKKLEEELSKVYDQRNDLIDLSQAKVCRECKRFGVLRGYLCFFCKADPSIPDG